MHPETPGTAPAAARSYFAAPPPPPGPNSGRARSASIAALDRPSSVMPPSAYGATSSEAHHYPGMDAYSYGGGMNGSSGADQHGWKPSGDGPGHISASLPTVSAVGSPSRGSALPHPSSSSVARGGGSGGGGSGGAYSPFGWNEDSAPLPTTAPGSGDREGRSRFRDLWGNTSAGGNGAGLSTSAGSTGGIGMSNMSPFSRDGSKLELDSWSGLSGLKNGGGGGGGGPHGRLLREHSLGAVGTGRKRSDAALWGRPTLLREVEDEDEDGSEEDAPDVFHAPTKSGATSRRHSFAAFDPPNRGATTHQIGFHLPPSSTHDAPSSSAGGGGGFGPLMAPVSSSAWNTQHHGGGGGLGSSAINDDDLAADLNSLHLNLEVAAASNEPPRAAARHLHVGSMPANFPPARTSRALEHSRSPPPPREVPIESNAAPAPAHAQPQPQPQGSSPRATAEPFTPSIGSSVGSRFLLQGLQAPTPLPPATTPVVATASPTLGGGPSPHPQQQQQHQPQQPYQPQPGNRYGPYGQFPPPVPPPITTQHQYFTPATAAPSALSPRGPPPRNGPGAFPGGYGNVPPPHLQQHGAAPLPPPVPPPPQPPLSYFNAPPPPPPGMPQLPQVAAPLTAQAQTDMNLGRGVPLHAIPPGAPLCIVGFKAGRKDLFFCEDPNLHLEEGDLVIVEADRGRDVGKFLKSVTVDEVHKFQQHLVELALGQLASGGGGGGGGGVNPMAGGMTSPASMGMGHDPSGGGQGGTAQLARMTKECQPKRIFAKAGPADTHALLSKAQDEVKALALVRSKVAQKGARSDLLWQVLLDFETDGSPSGRRSADGDPRRRMAVGPPQVDVLLHRRDARRLPRTGSRAVPHLEDSRLAVSARPFRLWYLTDGADLRPTSVQLLPRPATTLVRHPVKKKTSRSSTSLSLRLFLPPPPYTFAPSQQRVSRDELQDRKTTTETGCTTEIFVF